MPGGVSGGAASGGLTRTRLFDACAWLFDHTPVRVDRLELSIARYREAVEPMLKV